MSTDQVTREPIPWEAVLREEVPGLTYSEWLRTEPPLRAEALGHTVEYDPPFGMTRGERWTCTNRLCGAAVLRYDNNIYGSAATETCVEIQKRNAT